MERFKGQESPGIDIETLMQSPVYGEIIRTKTRMNIGFSLIMLVVYCVYFIAIAWYPQWMGSRLIENSAISIGIWFTVAAVIFSVILSGIYIYWANNYFDREMAKLLQDAKPYEG